MQKASKPNGKAIYGSRIRSSKFIISNPSYTNTKSQLVIEKQIHDTAKFRKRNKHDSQISMNVETISQSIHNICKQLSENKVPIHNIKSKLPDEISGSINKFMTGFLSEKLANMVPNNTNDDTSKLKNEIHLMLSMFIVSLKLFDLDDKILPFLLGGLGTKIDVMYQLILGLYNLILRTSKDGKRLSFEFDNETFLELVNSDPMNVRLSGGTGYNNHINLEAIDMILKYNNITLEDIHSKIYKNVKTLIEYLAL